MTACILYTLTGIQNPAVELALRLSVQTHIGRKPVFRFERTLRLWRGARDSNPSNYSRDRGARTLALSRRPRDGPGGWTRTSTFPLFESGPLPIGLHRDGGTPGDRAQTMGRFKCPPSALG